MIYSIDFRSVKIKRSTLKFKLKIVQQYQSCIMYLLFFIYIISFFRPLHNAILVITFNELVNREK